jgi:CubicO group peptidase (beta-lactamase class C family)
MRLVAAILFASLIINCGSDGPSGLTEDVGVAGDGQLGAVLDTIRAEFNLPALAAVLVHEGQIVELAATGRRAIGFEEQVTSEDRWHVGSLTKAMTANLAAVLVERGALPWDTTVGQVFPDLVGDIRSEYVDVRLDELLYHTAGLVEDASRAPSWPTLRQDPSPVREQRRRFASELLSLPPDGERGESLYSNAGYIVAGAMLERVMDESWEALMQREVFVPLGMDSSGFLAPGSPGVRDEPWGHLAQGSSWAAVQPGPLADNPAALGPAGTVHSTLADYAKYMVEHLAGARGSNGLVSAATFQKLHTPAPGTQYSLGWGVGEREWAGGTVLNHSGSNTMWWAVVWLAPERDLGLFAVANAGGDAAQSATDAAVVALIRRFEAAAGDD